MSTKRKILLVLLLPVVFFLVWQGGLFLYHQFRAHAAKGEVTTALAAALPKHDKIVAERTAALQQVGLVGKPVASSKAAVCYIDHEDAGWTVRNWTQECYVRSVVGFYTAYDKTEALQKIAGLNTIVGEVPSAYMQSVDSCLLAAINYAETALFLPANTPAQRSRDCSIPDQLDSRALVYTNIDPRPGIKTFQSFDTANLDTNQNQIWISVDTDYYHEDLGCGLGVLCMSPRAKAVQAP